MAERARTLWGYRALLLAMVCLVGFILLLPLNPGPGQLPGPDLIVLILFSWVIMRPDYVPVLMAAVIFLVADLLLMRPPGLWAGLSVIGMEFLRGRRVQLREATFLLEWLLLSAVIVAMTLINAAVLSVLALPQPSLGLTLIRMIFTCLCYPLVVILAGRAFGVRKPSPNDRIGQGL